MNHWHFLSLLCFIGLAFCCEMQITLVRGYEHEGKCDDTTVLKPLEMDFPASGASDHQLVSGEASKLGHGSPHYTYHRPTAAIRHVDRRYGEEK
jgi:hypothetical protein